MKILNKSQMPDGTKIQIEDWKLKKNEYVALKEKHQREMNEFPMYWAFGDKQWKELLEKLKLTEEQAKEKLIQGPAGCLILKDDMPKFTNMINKHNKEIKEAIVNDKTGTGYIKDMFCYELYNHEYCYTRDLTQTLMSLGLDEKSFENNSALGKGLKFALDTINRNEEISDYAENLLLPQIQEKYDNNSITEGEFNFLHKRDVWRNLSNKIIYEIQSIVSDEPLALEKEFDIIDKKIVETLEEAHKEFLIKEVEIEESEDEI